MDIQLFPYNHSDLQFCGDHGETFSFKGCQSVYYVEDIRLINARKFKFMRNKSFEYRLEIQIETNERKINTVFFSIASEKDLNEIMADILFQYTALKN